MLVLGQGALLVALITSLWALVAGILGGSQRSAPLAKSAGRSLVATFGLLLLASTALATALVTNDFRLKYVADYSSSTQALPYKLSALWAGQGGSLMFWAFLLALFGALVVLRPPKETPREFMPWIVAVMGGTTFFFALVTVVAANPFEPFPNGMQAVDGQGLNPLLQNFWMMIHPPTLYLGFVGCAIPFAYALASLFTGRSDAAWVRASRRWTLFTFGLLTLGIWLGGYWAYIELGWGGFWAWDPVENASLLPWLTLTAFVHTLIAQDKRGMMKVFNQVLVIVTFLLTIFGTFLTRSGIIQSVHAFGKSSIGNWFLGFILLAGVVSVVALVRALPRLRTEANIEKVSSREGLLLLGAALFVALTFIVFYLTMLPVSSQLLRGMQITAQVEDFNRWTKPVFLLLVVLMGLAPLATWRKAIGNVRGLAIPAAVAVALTLLLVLLGAREIWSVLYFPVVFFVCGTIVTDVVRMLKARRQVTNEALPRALVRTMLTHRRRFGAYVSHLSVVVMIIGIAGSMSYKTDVKLESMAQGQTAEVDGYRITYQGVMPANTIEYEGVRVRLLVERPDGGPRVVVMPELRNYRKTQQPSAEVAILSTLLPRSLSQVRRTGEDLYISLLAFQEDGRASVEVRVHPMVNWLWAGGVLLMLGTLIAFWPDRRGEEAAVLEALPQGAAASKA